MTRTIGQTLENPYADVSEQSEEIPDAVPVDDAEAVKSFTIFGLTELLLKHPGRADELMREETQQHLLIPRFLTIALASYTLFSVAIIIILNTAAAEAYPRHLLPVPRASWSDGSALGLVAAYNFGLIAASGICLPSFYFFALLAGVRMSMLQIVGQVMRCKATSALVLFGILPIYVACVLGMAVFDGPTFVLEMLLYLGLLLPFIAGLEGVRAIYRGVMGMASTLPQKERCARECFLRRLTLGWAACYTAVSPVLIYRVWDYLSGLIAV